MANITLGGKPTTTIGELPKTGSKLPDFKLVTNDMQEVSLSNYKGKNVILNIFPSIETSVCSASVRKFNEKAASLKNTVVLCISKDLPFTQKKFCGAEGIENAITLSDFRTPEFAKKIMGTEIVSGAFAGLNARSIVVLDEAGTVKYTELVPEIGQEPNYEAALGAV